MCPFMFLHVQACSQLLLLLDGELVMLSKRLQTKTCALNFVRMLEKIVIGNANSILEQEVSSTSIQRKKVLKSGKHLGCHQQLDCIIYGEITKGSLFMKILFLRDVMRSQVVSGLGVLNVVLHLQGQAVQDVLSSTA